MPETKHGLPGTLTAGECLGVAMFGVYAAILWTHAGMASLTDYSNWTYQGVLLRDHLLRVPDAAHWFKPYPVPNSAGTLGIGLLALVLPWMAATKVWICLQMAAEFVTLRHLLRTVGATAWAWAVLPVALFLNVNFWYGFANFELGLCWVLLMASVLLRAARGGMLRGWQVGGLLVLAFLTHMIPFAFCGLLLLLYARQTGKWKIVRQLVPAALLCVWYVAGRFVVAHNADGQAGMAASVKNYSAAFWVFKVNSYLKSFGFAHPSGMDAVLHGRTILLVLFAANLVLAALLGWRMVAEARRALAERTAERFLWFAALVVIPVCILAPGAMLGISDPGARLLQVVLALTLPLALRRPGPSVYVCALCALLLYAAGARLFAGAGFRTYTESAAASGLPAAVEQFARVPNHDQDMYFEALRSGDKTLPVFPTAMMLNGATPEQSVPFELQQTKRK